MNLPEKNHDDYQKGYGTEDSPNWRDLAARDSKPIPEILLEENSPDLGSAKIPPSVYTSYDHHREEVEKVWKRTWQVACREEEIPNRGDHFVYEVAGLSFLIVRSDENEFKAYWNACRHRGTKLVEKSGCGARRFRCPFHSWTWDLKGNLVNYPAKWDFPEVEAENYGLKETAVGTWGGFVFINPDKDAAPLSTHLGSLPEHFAKWPLDKRYTLWHVQQRIRANWKIVLEAFLEGYHVAHAHPQVISSVGDNGTQYDIWDEGETAISRLITPSGVPSAYSGVTPLDSISQTWELLAAARLDDDGAKPENITDRASLAEWRRQTLGEATGVDYSSLSDAEMLDSFQYWLFPNFCPWYGEGMPMSYQFRPDTDSPDSSYFDIWLLMRSPDNGEAPPPAPETIRLGPDDRLEDHIGAMGAIFDQDNGIMPRAQLGMKTWPDDSDGLTFARYQEMRNRFLHQVLERVMST